MALVDLHTVIVFTTRQTDFFFFSDTSLQSIDCVCSKNYTENSLVFSAPFFHFAQGIITRFTQEKNPVFFLLFRN